MGAIRHYFGGGNGKGRVEFCRDIKQISSDILQGIFSYGSFCRAYIEAIKIWRKIYKAK